MHARSTRELAVELRRNGFSYPYISLKTGLSKSTLSGWLSDIPYTPNREMVEAYGKSIACANERKVKLRQEAMTAVRCAAARDIGFLTERDLLVFGLGLYLGEGAKTHGVVRVVNSDPRVIQAMVAWFLSLGVRMKQFAITVHLYPDNDVDESLEFWSSITSIPIPQFHKTHIDMRTNKKAKKRGRLPYGTCHLSVQSQGQAEFGVVFARKIQAWNDSILVQVQRRN